MISRSLKSSRVGSCHASPRTRQKGPCGWDEVQLTRAASPRRRERKGTVPKLRIRDITVNYDQQGAGEPLVLIPYLAADYACYAFQVAEYSKHFTCVTIDLRGTGETDKPGGSYSTEQFADDIAAFMGAARIDRAHIA